MSSRGECPSRKKSDEDDADLLSTFARSIRKFADFDALNATDRARVIASLTEKECAELLYDWEFWSRADQKPPPGDWIHWLILAGRGAGKTRAGAEAVREWIKNFAIVNLVGPTHDDVRDVMVLGESDLMAICPTRSDRNSRAVRSASSGRTARSRSSSPPRSRTGCAASST